MRLAKQLDRPGSSVGRRWRVVRRRARSKILFWFLALVIGVAAGFAALGFRKGIEWLEATLYGTDDPSLLHTAAEALPWYWVLILPILGGLTVGIILSRFTPDARVRAVADVIEGAALHEGRVEGRAGLASAVASFITLSTGGSTGREGPVVHIASLISSWICNRIGASGITGRELLGCAVAAAVSASFNAPIAGALFALEVVLRHFAVHAFAPIAIASAAGTVINRLEYGGVTEFTLARADLGFNIELPAFLLLGLVCGLVAVVFMRAMLIAEDEGDRLQAAIGLPRVLRPALAGALLGAIAIVYPHIIGVGYETTSHALTGGLLLRDAIVFAVIKTAAVAITVGGRMGGGVFSPSLMLGALTGLAYGLIATAVFPEVSGSETLYALAGMGAVAAAVLGAPISTTLIVFEMTGDWQTGIAVMVSVSISTAVASKLVHRSYFLTQLEHRGIRLAAGPQSYILSKFRVRQMMRAISDDGADAETCAQLIEDGVFVDVSASLDTAMPVFERSSEPFVPVVSRKARAEEPKLEGALFQVDALRAYNRALAAIAAEEHA